MRPVPSPASSKNTLPPHRVESPIQLIQGWYYLVAGLCVAFAITLLQAPVAPKLNLQNLWFVRGVGLLVAAFGVGLIFASRPVRPVAWTIGVPIVLALVLMLSDVAGTAAGVLTSPFLMDAGMEGGFLLWWAVAFFFGGRFVNSPKNEWPDLLDPTA